MSVILTVYHREGVEVVRSLYLLTKRLITVLLPVHSAQNKVILFLMAKLILLLFCLEPFNCSKYLQIKMKPELSIKAQYPP